MTHKVKSLFIVLFVLFIGMKQMILNSMTYMQQVMFVHKSDVKYLDYWLDKHAKEYIYVSETGYSETLKNKHQAKEVSYQELSEREESYKMYEVYVFEDIEYLFYKNQKKSEGWDTSKVIEVFKNHIRSNKYRKLIFITPHKPKEIDIIEYLHIFRQALFFGLHNITTFLFHYFAFSLMSESQVPQIKQLSTPLNNVNEFYLRLSFIYLPNDYKKYKPKTLFTPSLLDQVKKCPGSFYYPSTSFPYHALVGNNKHEHASNYLKYALNNGYVALPDHLKDLGLWHYLDYCTKLIQSSGLCLIEEMISIESHYICEMFTPDQIKEIKEIQGDKPYLFRGKADFISVGGNTIEVVDLKTGVHAVDIEKQYLQLISYAFLFLWDRRIKWDPDRVVKFINPITNIKLTIVQGDQIKTSRFYVKNIHEDFVEKFLTKTLKNIIINVINAKDHPEQHLNQNIKDPCNTFCQAYKEHVKFKNGEMYG